MDDPVPFDLPEDVRAELDAMSPERRHEWLDRLHAQHGVQVQMKETMLHAATRVDAIADIMRSALIGRLEDQPEESQTEFLDYLMGYRMRAEWMRAAARGDAEAAKEYLAKAEDYEERSKDFTPRLAAE
ncbi:hypothetical protein [Kutzneria sp. NPDC052558]|uniref:hypothetical protein n=1 Tax=Kutzneria sp. NPDC052558 TaxID=3364121 RepID=UPI0037C57E9E